MSSHSKTTIECGFNFQQFTQEILLSYGDHAGPLHICTSESQVGLPCTYVVQMMQFPLLPLAYPCAMFMIEKASKVRSLIRNMNKIRFFLLEVKITAHVTFP